MAAEVGWSDTQVGRCGSVLAAAAREYRSDLRSSDGRTRVTIARRVDKLPPAWSSRARCSSAACSSQSRALGSTAVAAERRAAPAACSGRGRRRRRWRRRRWRRLDGTDQSAARRHVPHQARHRHRQREPHLRQLLRLVPRRRGHATIADLDGARCRRAARADAAAARSLPRARLRARPTGTGGAMNGWDRRRPRQRNGDNLAYAQYSEADIPNYWQYARHFTLADHFFANVLGPRFPGHMFVLAAQAGWALGNPIDSDHAPVLGLRRGSAGSTRRRARSRAPAPSKQVFPCFDIPERARRAAAGA